MLEQILQLLKDIRVRTDELISKIKISANQITVNALSEIAETLGLIKAGEFRVGNGKEPGSGFTGVRIASPPVTYNSETWVFAVVENDVLQLGMKTAFGKLYAGNGSTVIDVNGIVSTVGTLGGWTIGSTTITSGTSNISLDSANKTITVNDPTFGNSGVQIDYNSGTPRFYVGNGVDKYFKFDGTNAFVNGVQFANTQAILSANGIDIDDMLSYAFRQGFTNDSKKRIGKITPDVISGSTTPVWAMTLATPTAAEVMTNGGFELGDFSNWTKTTETNGAWAIDAIVKQAGLYSAKWTPTRFGYGGVKSLLHFEGADASTTFTDVSGKTWTKYNHAQIDTAQFALGAASGLFDGTDDYIDTPDHADFTLGSGDFEIAFRMRPHALQNNTILGQNKSDLSFANTSFRIGLYDTGEIWAVVNSGGSGYSVTSGINIYSADTWYTISFTRHNNVLTLYIDGVALDTLDVTGITVNNSAYKLAMGRSGEYNGSYFNGWIDEFYFSNGYAIHTTDYTPEIAAWVDIKTEGILTSDAYTVTVSTAYLISAYLRGTLLSGTIKAEVKWYSDAGATTLISTDTIGNLLGAGGFETKENVFTSPATAIRAKVVLTCSSSTTSEINFDDISISLSTVNQALWLSDAGVGLKNSLQENGMLDWGTYTPTVFDTTNVTASIVRPLQWMRVGEVVTVSGSINVDPVGAGLTELRISLPVLSQFTQTWECGGVGKLGITSADTFAFSADVAKNRILMSSSLTTTSAQEYSFSFTYKVVRTGTFTKTYQTYDSQYVMRSNQPTTVIPDDVSVGENNASVGYVRRSVIKWDALSDPIAFPPGSTVTACSMFLTGSLDSSSNARTISAYRLLVPFGANCCWNNRVTGTPWTTAGASDLADREAAAIGSAVQPAALPFVVEIVLDPAKIQEYVDGTLDNNGFLLQVDTELNDQIAYADKSTPSTAPYLVITYTL